MKSVGVGAAKALFIIKVKVMFFKTTKIEIRLHVLYGKNLN